MTNAARKPGERWLEPEDGLGLFVVHECGEDGRTLTVAAHQYHADALLLVHGRALVGALNGLLNGLLDGLDANGDPERCGLSMESWRRRIAAARIALDNTEVGG